MKQTNYLLQVALLFISFMITGCTSGISTGVEKIPVTADPRSELLFDFGWHFYRGEIDGAENPGFDDSSWRLVDLPHDWSIENIPGTDSPIDSAAIGGIDSGYLVGGTGWYRKTFIVPSILKGKRFSIQFEGIYMNAEVWLNGKHLGNHPYGYTSFSYDITDDLKYNEENILAIEVKNEGRNSRWYSGSGIYRHVWLTVLNPVQIVQWGTYISTPEISASGAKIHVKTNVLNGANILWEVILKTTILDPSGNEVAQSSGNHPFKSGETYEFTDEMEVISPQKWSVETPVLYMVVSEVFTADDTGKQTLADRLETVFGIRSISFDTRQGFLLNGQPVLLKGGCMHHDNGPLGSAAFDRAEERRVELMEASGFNSIRCAHNPPSPGFLDACDRLGILVIDESFDMWDKPKNGDDYHLYFNDWWQRDVESMVLRDRNHPSVVMWSIGNEIPDRGEPSGVALARKQADYVRSLDPSRPITSAVNSVAPDKDPYFATLDICGYNYARDNYVSDHKRLPDRIVVTTESFPLEAFDYWMAVLDNPWVIGDYVWTGFDYLGEASIGWLGYFQSSSFFPWTHAFCGDIDICGFKRPQSYYRDALWGNNKNISIFIKPPVPSFNMVNPDHADWSKWNWQDVVADWTWPGYENTPLDIEVYSNCTEVELFLDKESLGKKKNSRETEFITRWNVPYKASILRAVGFENQHEVASAELSTAGESTSIKLLADRTSIKADGQDLSYITIEVVDEKGVRNPKAKNQVQFEIEGPGTIVAVGSSNPMGSESFKQPRRKAYQGRCLVVVRAERNQGEIILKALSEGLVPGQVTLVAR